MWDSMSVPAGSEPEVESYQQVTANPRRSGDKPALRSRGRALRKSASEQRGASGTTPAATARTVAEPEEPAETRRSDPEEAIGPGGERAEP